MSLINRQKKKVTVLSREINPDNQGAIGLLLTKVGRAGQGGVYLQLTSSSVGSSTLKRNV